MGRSGFIVSCGKVQKIFFKRLESRHRLLQTIFGSYDIMVSTLKMNMQGSVEVESAPEDALIVTPDGV